MSSNSSNSSRNNASGWVVVVFFVLGLMIGASIIFASLQKKINMPQFYGSVVTETASNEMANISYFADFVEEDADPKEATITILDVSKADLAVFIDDSLYVLPKGHVSWQLSTAYSELHICFLSSSVSASLKESAANASFKRAVPIEGTLFFAPNKKSGYCEVEWLYTK